jgi:hypothetical protein
MSGLLVICWSHKTPGIVYNFCLTVYIARYTVNNFPSSYEVGFTSKIVQIVLTMLVIVPVTDAIACPSLVFPSNLQKHPTPKSKLNFPNSAP